MSAEIKVCPVCKQAGKPEPERIYAENVHWHFWCPNCGVMFADLRAWKSADLETEREGE